AERDWRVQGQAERVALLHNVSHPAAGGAARLLGRSLRTGAGHAAGAAHGQSAVNCGFGACPSALRTS
ncbi:hypothetical protein COCSUDRAFT_64798, partial [Coccomyxa subellipsoidea C-169]